MEDLPDVVVEKVLSYVGNARDFRSLERSCKSLHEILKKDELWSMCQEMNYRQETTIRTEENEEPEARNYPALYKDYVMVCLAWQEVEKWQNSSESIILSVLTVNEWKALVKGCEENVRMDMFKSYFECTFRGDSAALLLTYVEHFIVAQFLNPTLSAAIRRTQNSKEYPEVTCQDAQCLAELNYPVLEPVLESVSRHMTGRFSYIFVGHISVNDREVLVRRFAYRAGIMKINYDMIEYVWLMLMAYLQNLLRELLNELYHQDTVDWWGEDDVVGKRVLPEKTDIMSRQTMHYVPPHPERSEEGGCLDLFTVVPGQLESAARRLQLGVTFCRDDAWLVESDELKLNSKTRKEKEAIERKKAEDQYIFLPQDEFDAWNKTESYDEEDPIADRPWDPSTIEFSDSDDEVVSWNGSEMSGDSD